MREYAYEAIDYPFGEGAGEQASGDTDKAACLAFVLLKSDAWDRSKFMWDFQELWGFGLAETEYEDDYDNEGPDKDSFVAEIDGMLVAVSCIHVPIPNKEAEICAANNFLWPEAANEVAQHTAHVIVSVLPKENSIIKANTLLVQICTACLQAQNAIGVYTAGTVFDPDSYEMAADVIRNGELPYLNWVHLGLVSGSEDTISGYTYGLATFGKDEIEIINTTARPDELYNLLFEIAAFVIDEDLVMHDGETIGFTEDQRLSITRSPGVNIEGMTLKIEY